MNDNSLIIIILSLYGSNIY